MNRLRRTATATLGAAVLLAAACATVEAPGPPGGIEWSQDPLPGKFVWHDLLSEDPAAAKAFYGGLLGWEFEETTAFSGRHYTLAKSGGRFVAGIVPVERTNPGQAVSQWMGYISVPDVDGAVKQTKASGGSAVVEPFDLPEVGRAAAVRDPQGALVGFLRIFRGDPADRGDLTAGKFLWMEHLGLNPRAAAEFYSALLGYEVMESTVEGVEYFVLKRGRKRAGVMQMPVSGAVPNWLPYVVVDDPAAAAARAGELGGEVILEPRADIRNGNLALVADPSGAVLALQKWPL